MCAKMVFKGGCEVPGNQVIGPGPPPVPPVCACTGHTKYHVRLHFLMRKGAGEPLKSFATPDSRRAATRLDASFPPRSAPLRSAPLSIPSPDFIPPNHPVFRSSILVGGTCTTVVRYQKESEARQFKQTASALALRGPNSVAFPSHSFNLSDASPQPCGGL
jgi:hypothetical protein